MFRHHYNERELPIELKVLRKELEDHLKTAEAEKSELLAHKKAIELAAGYDSTSRAFYRQQYFDYNRTSAEAKKDIAPEVTHRNAFLLAGNDKTVFDIVSNQNTSSKEKLAEAKKVENKLLEKARLSSNLFDALALVDHLLSHISVSRKDPEFDTILKNVQENRDKLAEKKSGKSSFVTTTINLCSDFLTIKHESGKSELKVEPVKKPSK